jgi:DNA polymerase III epsilon subunit-like protein
MLPSRAEFYKEPRLAPQLDAEPGALKVNGFTEEQLRDHGRLPMHLALKDFVKWAKKADDMILCGWNGAFDFRFLSTEFDREGMDFPFGYRLVDLHTLAYYFFRVRDNWTPMHDGISTVGLNYTLKKLGLPPEPEPHNALTGAKCNLLVLETITKMLRYEAPVALDEPKGLDIALPGEADPWAEAGFAGPGDPDYDRWLSRQE